MFQVYGQQGRVFSGTLEQLRQLQPVSAVARARRAAAVATGQEAPSSTHADAGGAPKQQALAAYNAVVSGGTRQPLSRVADVMHTPAHVVLADATVREAWRTLAQHGIGQAPVADAGGTLVGLLGRAELLPAAWLERSAVDPAAWLTLLAQPVAKVMWSPVPCATPDTDLRRVASLLLDTGLPGLPVADDSGRVLGFVSRSDLLRALDHDPPLDLWG